MSRSLYRVRLETKGVAFVIFPSVIFWNACISFRFHFFADPRKIKLTWRNRLYILCAPRIFGAFFNVVLRCRFIIRVFVVSFSLACDDGIGVVYIKFIKCCRDSRLPRTKVPMYRPATVTGQCAHPTTFYCRNSCPKMADVHRPCVFTVKRSRFWRSTSCVFFFFRLSFVYYTNRAISRRTFSYFIFMTVVFLVRYNRIN